MRVMNLLVLIIIVMVMFVGQSVYESDVEYNTTRDIYNFTESTIKWDSSIADRVEDSMNEKINLSEYDINTERAGSVLGKFVDFVGYSFTQVLKWGVEYGYTHPEHDLSFFLQFLIKILWIFVLLAFIPLIIPIIALIYLLFKGMCWLFKKLMGVVKI